MIKDTLITLSITARWLSASMYSIVLAMRQVMVVRNARHSKRAVQDNLVQLPMERMSKYNAVTMGFDLIQIKNE